MTTKQTSPAMNKAQTARIQRLSRDITKHAQLGSGNWLNGPVVFSIEPVAGDTIMFSATTGTDEQRWFDTHCFTLIFVGPRGGVRIRHCEGFSRALIA